MSAPDPLAAALPTAFLSTAAECPTEAILVTNSLDIQLPTHGGKDGIDRTGEKLSLTENTLMGHPEWQLLLSWQAQDTRKGRLSAISLSCIEGPGAVAVLRAEITRTSAGTKCP